MTDNTGATPANVNNQNDGGKGTDPKTTSNANASDVQDVKPGENAFNEKVFEDPRLWQHPRFKSLNERAKLADKLEQEKSAAEEARLADAKKFEELANKRAQERDAATSKLSQSIQDNRIIIEASKVGVVDTETVLKLVDRANITVDANGNVTGVVEALQALLTSKPFLKGKPGATTIGSGTNPGNDAGDGIKKFKLSQLNDTEFFRKNEKDIMAAYAKGLIEDDVHK